MRDRLSRADSNDMQALIACVAGPQGRGEGPAVKHAGRGGASVRRLLAAGLMEVDPDWSGCYRATDAGRAWLEAKDAGRAWLDAKDPGVPD